MKQVFTNPPYMNLFFTIGELNLNYIISYLVNTMITVVSMFFFLLCVCQAEDLPIF